jgi:hypothetical protein
MGARRYAAALAISAMLSPVAAQAADAIGTVSSGTSALIARDGRVIPAVAGMKLYSSDRVITRAGGSAKVAMGSSNCAVSVGASAMLPMSGATCAKPNVIAFDEGRAGYAGTNSAFQAGPHPGFWIFGLAFAAGFAAVLYAILHNPRGGNFHFPVPASPG